MEPTRIYGLDIETDNSHGHGLDPRMAAITDIAIATDTRHSASGGEVFSISDLGSESAMLREAASFIRRLPVGLIATWNGVFFDLPFLHERASLYRDVDLGLCLRPAPSLRPKYQPLPGHATEENPGGGYDGYWKTDDLWGGAHAHIDIAPAYRRTAADLGVKWSLKPVAVALDIDMVELDRTRLHTYSVEERMAYNLSDATGTRSLAMRALGVHPDETAAA